MKITRRDPAVALLCVLAASPLVAQKPVAKAQPGNRISEITMTHMNYHGWDATVLRNHVAEVMIVPAIGRIMQFHFSDEGAQNQAAENIFWNNPDLGPQQKPDVEGWRNYGGDKVWPAPQSDWPNITGSSWPPPLTFDSMPYSEEVEGDHVKLLSAVDPHYGIRMRRTIALDPQLPIMTVKTTFEKVQGSPLTVGIWSVTQLCSPDRAFILLPANSRFPHGYVTLLPARPKGLKIDHRLLSLARDAATNTMIGSDGGTLLWVGKDSDLLIENKTAVLPSEKTVWPDQGLHSKIFTHSGDALPYVELELFTPLSTLKTGDVAFMESTYTLLRRTEQDPFREARKVFASDFD
jgi:hypothetical protein